MLCLSSLSVCFLSSFLSFFLSVCLSVCLSVFLSFCFSVFLSFVFFSPTFNFIYQSIFLSFYLAIFHPSIRPSVRLSVCLSVYNYMSLSVYTYLSTVCRLTFETWPNSIQLTMTGNQIYAWPLHVSNGSNVQKMIYFNKSKEAFVFSACPPLLQESDRKKMISFSVCRI